LSANCEIESKEAQYGTIMSISTRGGVKTKEVWMMDYTWKVMS
jgi:hypothetical protein